MSSQNPQSNLVPNLLIATAVLAAIGLVGSFLVWFFFLHTEAVDPGHQGVIIDKPYFWGHEGVRKDEILKEGRITLWRSSKVKPVRMMPQSVSVAIDDFSSEDNILLDFETAIQYRFTDPIRLVTDFGDDWFSANIRQQYLAIVREAVKKRTMANMMSNPKTAQDIDDEVTKALVAHVKSLNLPLVIMNVSLGRAKPNAKVLEQMNETAAQQQLEKTMVAAEAAQIKRKKEQIARADADNAYRNAINLSPEQFVTLQVTKMWSEACLKASTCVINPNAHK